MRRSVIFLLIVFLIGSLFPSKINVGYAAEKEDSAEEVFTKGSSYFFIHYNGEDREIEVNEQLTLTLTGWTDDAKQSVQATISQTIDSVMETKEAILANQEELQYLAVNENENIFLRIVPADTLDVEKVTPFEFEKHHTIITEHENGTSVEVEKIIDEYGTVIETSDFFYYITDENLEKNPLSKEEYEEINISNSEDLSLEAENPTDKDNTTSDLEKDKETSTDEQSEPEVDEIAGSEEEPAGVDETTENDENQSGVGESTESEEEQTEVDENTDQQVVDESPASEAPQEDTEKKETSTDDVSKDKVSPSINAKAAISANPTITYATHIQNSGWQTPVSNGATSGTVGQEKRIEAIKLSLENLPYSGGVSYKTHVQNNGWQQQVANGAISGTTGQSKRVEAIQINLTGDVANYYDIYYRVHVQSYGWLGWAKNGESAGSQGYSKRLEAIEVVLVTKGANPPGSTGNAFKSNLSITYSAHVQTYGWMGEVTNGKVAGTTGQSKRLEAIKVNLKNAPYSGDIVYSTHVQNSGWLGNVSNGTVSGTTGQNKRMEAIRIQLTGEIANYYDVYYRVHAQSYGWLGWAKNGMSAGSTGLSKRLEAVEIKLVPKGQGQAVNEDAAFKLPKIVFLDPGHGGSDPGAVSGGYKEATLNLAVAKKAQALLQKSGYKVYMSRTDDRYVSLIDRAKMANAIKADIFISIHHNSTGTSTTTAQGIESYYYEYSPSYPSEINGDMHNNPQRIANSIDLTNFIHSDLIKSTGANNRGIDGRSFAVVREVSMPATLLELGFINNPTERNKLITESYQNKLAQSITTGINNYFNGK